MQSTLHVAKAFHAFALMKSRPHRWVPKGVRVFPNVLKRSAFSAARRGGISDRKYALGFKTAVVYILSPHPNFSGRTDLKVCICHGTCWYGASSVEGQQKVHENLLCLLGLILGSKKKKAKIWLQTTNVFCCSAFKNWKWLTGRKHHN